ncbi:MAG: ABC-F family ATP-binding cassette domain-containing protein [Carbonactinosporaceae bacterium]
MINAVDVELRAGSRLLLEPCSFRVRPGDRVGLVGRNGAGKTTLAKVLAQEALPAGGTVSRSGAVGYLPQDPRTGDMGVRARDRILSARGLDDVTRQMRDAERRMASAVDGTRDAAMRRYARLESEFLARGGYSAEAESASISSSLGLPERVLEQPLRTLSGGQRRRVELARILFSGVATLLLDEPTNHLDADSIRWLRDYLRSHRGGLVVISHDVSLLEHTVNRVFHLDSTRSALDVYNVGWRAYLTERAADEQRRRRARVNAQKQASALMAQADRMRAKATKAKAAKSMQRRADRLLSDLPDLRRQERVAKLRFPEPAPCGRTPLTAVGLAKSYGSLEVFAGVDLAVDRGSRVVVLGLNGAGKTTLLRLLAGVERPDAGAVHRGHGLRLGYYAQEHEILDLDVTVRDNMRAAAPHLTDADQRGVLGSFLFSGDAADQDAATLSGGEKTRLSLATLVVSRANVLLLDEPTNNLDPASRTEVLAALRSYRGAIVLVTHDEGAVEALAPERLILLPDGVEDLWGDDYADLVALA